MPDTRTPWQRKQDAILDGCKSSIDRLPRSIRTAVEYGIYRQCRSLVGMLDQPRNAGSSHGAAEKMVAELAFDLSRITVKETADA